MKTYLIFIFLIYRAFASELNTCELDETKRRIICKNILGQFPSYPQPFFGGVLECASCDLSVFSQKTFPYENRISAVNLSSSGIEFVRSKSFSVFKNAHFFYLQDNKITNVSKSAFSGLRQVYELHLENNYITYLQDGFLDDFEVSSVALSHNKLKVLPSNIFKGVLGLLSLELQNNMIKTLHPETFSGLESLEYLILENNQLCYIPLGTFSHVKTLKHLNLSGNKFTRFPIGVFSGLKYLESLSLARNNLADFDGSFLVPFNHLSKLDVTENGIYFFDAVNVYKNVPTIRNIHLGGNIFSCSVLMNVMQYFKKYNVEVVNDAERFDIQNINGIVCIDNIITTPISYEYFLNVAKEETKNGILYC
ncbi:insulin-like growth factor-binding protein complex acid labile subunit [Aethina tumida]|uniref:insulin-like growth factor-binding protein complex acid labile subunit n=1 Tax=Aethina tumida TaxID=116153 RepID=UPI00096AFE81|nr:insulin-like growth factor-binding protein complex acid labile subunit [Aethina tumida]